MRIRHAGSLPYYRTHRKTPNRGCRNRKFLKIESSFGRDPPIGDFRCVSIQRAPRPFRRRILDRGRRGRSRSPIGVAGVLSSQAENLSPPPEFCRRDRSRRESCQSCRHRDRFRRHRQRRARIPDESADIDAESVVADDRARNPRSARQIRDRRAKSDNVAGDTANDSAHAALDSADIDDVSGV
jgi:hypothetical protein